MLQPFQRDRISQDSTFSEAKPVLERNGENLEVALAEIQDVLLGVYGGLSYDGPAVPLTATTTPQIIAAFDTVGPARSVDADAAADTLTALAAGQYLIGAQITAGISSGTAYVLELYAGGVQTSIRAAVDASNQTSAVFLSLAGLRTIPANLPIDLRVSTDSGTGAFDVANAEFNVARIGL